MRSRCLLALLLPALLSSCGDFQQHEYKPYNLPIFYGDPDTNPDHAAVVGVYDNYQFCTGTLITSTVVLTAAHCVSNRSFNILFGNNVDFATRRSVTETKVHPGWNPDYLTNDIALMHMSSAAPSGTVPIPYLPSRLEITDADIGRPLEFVGYGQTETGGFGIKMTVTNNLDWVCTNPSGCSLGSGRYASPYTICQDQNPGGPCQGDSGGPALVVRNDQEYVAGITSYGDQNCTLYGCSTKVDEFETFITDFVGGVPGASCYSSAECLSGFCVDGVCCTSRCDGVCQACNLTGNGTCTTVPNQTPCPDSNLCDGTEVCQSGQCVEGQPLECTNNNPCTIDRCDPASGCIHDPVLDGTPCSNGNPCDGEETCLRGNCAVGDPKDCDDHNLCTTDSCDPASGCVHEVLQDGTGCGGGPCGPGTCSMGECVLSDPTLCDDEDPCTQDWCEPDSGCQHETYPDGWECGECKMCLSSVCIHLEDCVEVGGECGCGAGAGRQGIVWILLGLALLFMRKR